MSFNKKLREEDKSCGGLTEKPPAAEFIRRRRSARKAYSDGAPSMRNGTQLASKSLSLSPFLMYISIGNETKVAVLSAPKGRLCCGGMTHENALIAKFAYIEVTRGKRIDCRSR